MVKETRGFSAQRRLVPTMGFPPAEPPDVPSPPFSLFLRDIPADLSLHESLLLWLLSHYRF